MSQPVSGGLELRHRPDIDGLRAIAVIPVILYHARLPSTTGGFVGVDVFFVISGFLITRLILEDIRTRRFSLASFYERRVRRILPALLGILVFSSVAAYALFLPDDLSAYAASLLATLAYSSNILFWRQAGYFDQPSEVKPLLHTWSLAVEEQFYILFPLFLWALSRYFRQRYALAIALVLALSLVLSVGRTTIAPTEAFYLAHTRAWELLLGALLAINIVPPVRRPVPAALLGFAGLACIGYSVFAFSPATPFPGANALWPTVGAALVIHSGSATPSVVTQLLGARPLVFIGLISYSLYLWHWVLIVFARYYLVRRMSAIETGTVLTASLLLAILSWRFVERPFRGRTGIGSRKLIFSALALSTLALGMYGGAALATKGFIDRFSQGLTPLAARTDIWPRYGECTDSTCEIGPAGRPARFILWGDSHAGAIAPAVERVADSLGIPGLIAVHTACAPMLLLTRYDPWRRPCSRVNDSVLARIEAGDIRTVILHARWALYAEGYRFGQEEGPPVLLSPRRRVEDNPAEFARLLRGTLAELRRRGLNVVIIASIPEVGVNVPRALAVQARSGADISLTPRREDFLTRQARAFQVLEQAARDYDANIVYPHEALCDSAACAITRDGYPLYSDGDHLSMRGAEYLRPLIGQVLVTAR